MSYTTTGTTGGFLTDNQTHWQYGYQPVTIPGPSQSDEWNRIVQKYVDELKRQEQKVEDDVVHGAMRERRAEQAKERITFLDNEFMSMTPEDGSTVVWRVSFHDTPSKTYHYVALKGGAYWYVTGDSGKHTLDSLIEKIVTLAGKGVLYFEDTEEPL